MYPSQFLTSNVAKTLTNFPYFLSCFRVEKCRVFEDSRYHVQMAPDQKKKKQKKANLHHCVACYSYFSCFFFSSSSSSTTTSSSSILYSSSPYWLHFLLLLSVLVRTRNRYKNCGFALTHRRRQEAPNPSCKSVPEKARKTLPKRKIHYGLKEQNPKTTKSQIGSAKAHKKDPKETHPKTKSGPPKTLISILKACWNPCKCRTKTHGQDFNIKLGQDFNFKIGQTWPRY